MTPAALSEFLTQWGLVAFSIYTGLVALSSITVKILASYVKGMQENVPKYKPSMLFYRVLAFLEALALNSPAATALLSTRPGMTTTTTTVKVSPVTTVTTVPTTKTKV